MSEAEGLRGILGGYRGYVANDQTDNVFQTVVEELAKADAPMMIKAGGYVVLEEILQDGEAAKAIKETTTVPDSVTADKKHNFLMAMKIETSKLGGTPPPTPTKVEGEEDSEYKQIKKERAVKNLKNDYPLRDMVAPTKKLLSLDDKRQLVAVEKPPEGAEPLTQLAYAACRDLHKMMGTMSEQEMSLHFGEEFKELRALYEAIHKHSGHRAEMTKIIKEQTAKEYEAGKPILAMTIPKRQDFGGPAMADYLSILLTCALMKNFEDVHRPSVKPIQLAVFLRNTIEKSGVDALSEQLDKVDKAAYAVICTAPWAKAPDTFRRLTELEAYNGGDFYEDVEASPTEKRKRCEEAPSKPQPGFKLDVPSKDGTGVEVRVLAAGAKGYCFSCGNGGHNQARCPQREYPATHYMCPRSMKSAADGGPIKWYAKE